MTRLRAFVIKMTNMIVADAAFCNEGDPDRGSGTAVEVLTRKMMGAGRLSPTAILHPTAFCRQCAALESQGLAP